MQEWCDPHQKADFPARVYRELLLQVILFGRMVVPEASPTHPLTIIHDRRDRFQMRRNWSLHRPIDHGRQQAEYGRISCAWLFRKQKWAVPEENSQCIRVRITFERNSIGRVPSNPSGVQLPSQVGSQG